MRLGLLLDERGPTVLEYVAGPEGLNPLQLRTFIERCLAKYDTKRIDPGGWGGGEPWGGTVPRKRASHWAQAPVWSGQCVFL